jgi:hypothetical protein
MSVIDFNVDCREGGCATLQTHIPSYITLAQRSHYGTVSELPPPDSAQRLRPTPTGHEPCVFPFPEF